MHPGQRRIDPTGLRNPAAEGALDEHGQLRVLPAAFWQRYTTEERAFFGFLTGAYCFPTEELVAWLKDRIAGRRAIEIGSGNGVLAAALGIPATDSKLMEDPDVSAYYWGSGQPTTRYGENVEPLDAESALQLYRPEVVVAAWVTHKYRRSEHHRGGNMYGVAEEKILRKCEYLFVGHEAPHKWKPIRELPHEELYPDWLASRASSPGRDFVAVWKARR